MTFLTGLVKHIENKNQSARRNFAALKNCTMLNVFLTKTVETLVQLYHLFIKLMQNEQHK